MAQKFRVTQLILSGQDVVGMFYPLTSNPSGYVTNSTVSGGYATISNLNLTGSSIAAWTGSSTALYYPKVGNPSGYITSNGIYKFNVTVDFGFANSGQGMDASITLSGSSGNFVNANTTIICTPLGSTTLNHSPDDIWAEGISAYASNVISGVSFDVVAIAPDGTFGQYQIGVVCY